MMMMTMTTTPAQYKTMHFLEYMQQSNNFVWNVNESGFGTHITHGARCQTTECSAQTRNELSEMSSLWGICLIDNLKFSFFLLLLLLSFWNSICDAEFTHVVEVFDSY